MTADMSLREHLDSALQLALHNHIRPAGVQDQIIQALDEAIARVDLCACGHVDHGDAECREAIRQGHILINLCRCCGGKDYS